MHELAFQSPTTNFSLPNPYKLKSCIPIFVLSNFTTMPLSSFHQHISNSFFIFLLILTFKGLCSCH